MGLEEKVWSCYHAHPCLSDERSQSIEGDSMDSKAQEVQEYLVKAGLEPLNFDQPTPTSAAAAEAVGCSVGEIAKSILLLVGKMPVMVITSGDSKVKSGRLKQASGLTGKVRLPEADEVHRYTGFKPGGVSPFLLPEEIVLELGETTDLDPIFYDPGYKDFIWTDAEGNLIEELEASGNLVITGSWPGQIRTVYGDHQRVMIGQ